MTMLAVKNRRNDNWLSRKLLEIEFNDAYFGVKFKTKPLPQQNKNQTPYPITHHNFLNHSNNM